MIDFELEEEKQTSLLEDVLENDFGISTKRSVDSGNHHIVNSTIRSGDLLEQCEMCIKILTSRYTEMWKNGYFYSIDFDGHLRGSARPKESAFTREEIIEIIKSETNYEVLKIKQTSIFDFI